jgi:hypothetical protein
MKNGANALSPTTSIKTPYTPTFVGGEPHSAVEGLGNASASVQSVPTEDVNVFESTLSVPTNGAIASTDSAEPASRVSEAETSQSAEGPEIAYLPESGPGGNLGSIYNAVLRYIEYDLGPIIDAANILRRRTKTPRRDRLDFAISSDLVGSAGSATPTAELPGLSKVDDVGIEEDEDGFEFVSRVVWVEIGERILSEIGNSVFAAGRVTELHQVSLVFRHLFQG